MGKKYFCIRRKPKRKRLIFSISKKTSISSPQEFISFYTEEENFLLINKYGKEIINNQFSSDYQIDHNYLYRIKISNELRRISLMWIYSIVIENNFDLDIYFLSVFIFDKYLDSNKEINSISKEELKNIAFTSFFLSTKYDCIVPFNIDNNPLINVAEMAKLENDILKTLNYSIKLNSSYYFIQYFFCDLKAKNKERIHQLDIDKYITAMNRVSIAFAKLITLDVSFYKHSQSLIAIGCVIKGYDYIMNKSTTITEEQMNFLKEWITAILNKKNDIFSHTNVMTILKDIERYWNVSCEDFSIIDESELYIE